MKSKTLLFISVLLLLCAVPMKADNKKYQDICKGMLFFSGDVVKDKANKQKMPSGQGKLFVRGYDGNNIVDNIAVTGYFDGDTVTNASFYINEEKASYFKRCLWNDKLLINNWSQTVFEGTMSYSFDFDKETKSLRLKVELLEGELLGIVKYNHEDYLVPLKITPENSVFYVMTFKKSDRIPYHHAIKTYGTSIKVKSQILSSPYEDIVLAPIKPFIEEITLSAVEYEGRWRVTIDECRLKNNIKFRPVYSDEGRGKLCNFSLFGKDGVYFGEDDRNHVGLKLPLEDGGYFEFHFDVYANDSKGRLYFPTGEVFDGTFRHLPFISFRDIQYGNLDDKCKAVANIMKSKSTDFTMGDGMYYNTSGKSERVKDGEFPDRVIETKLAEFNHGLDYVSLISGAKLLSANYDYYLNLCSRDFWKYIGRGDISELDKSIYKKRPEYTTQYQAYTSALNGLLYEVVSCYASNFTTKGATIYKNIDLGNSAAKNLPLLPIDRNNWWQSALPLKSTCQSSPDESRVKFVINSTDIDFLKYLQDANTSDELALLCIMKPGTTIEYNPYDAIPTAVGLYLINKSTNTVLYDLSNYLDTSNPVKYKAIFKQINTKDKAAYKRKADSEMREYRNRYGQNAHPCGTCGGTGYRTYWSNGRQYKKVCNVCGGRGRYYTR